MYKLFSIIAASVVVAAGSASAYDSFTLNQVQDTNNIVRLSPVMSTGNGVVEIYDFHGGMQGRLLGSEAVSAGANSNVDIPLGNTTSERLLAILKVNGQVMDEQVIRIEDDKG